VFSKLGHEPEDFRVRVTLDSCSMFVSRGSGWAIQWQREAYHRSQLGNGFDCASKSEIDMALQTGIDPSRIIYAQPCKTSGKVALILYSSSALSKVICLTPTSEA
jgi:hypothetical protein